MKVSKRFLSQLCTTLFLGFTLLISCENEVQPDAASTGNNNNGSNTSSSKTFSPDEISDLLMLKNSTKLVGVPPLPTGGSMLLNKKDSIYLVNGVSFGDRLVVKHDGLHDVTGFYIAVSNSSIYFDVPVVPEESVDETDVFFLNVGNIEGVAFPFSFEVAILPHVNGIPVKKFVRVVTVENGDDDEQCLPTTSGCEFDCMNWIWEFTVIEDNSGDIHTAYAPGMFIKLGMFDHGGCCWNNISIPAKHDPYCLPGNPEYVSILVDDQYYVRYFESLDLYDSGTYVRFMDHEHKTYSPDSSNYCEALAGYMVNRSLTTESGTHGFSLDNKVIYFTVTSRQDALTGVNTTSGWTFNGGSISYACNSLIISQIINGEKWSVVYRRGAVNFNPIKTYIPEYYE